MAGRTFYPPGKPTKKPDRNPGSYSSPSSHSQSQGGFMPRESTQAMSPLSISSSNSPQHSRAAPQTSISPARSNAMKMHALALAINPPLPSPIKTHTSLVVTSAVGRIDRDGHSKSMAGMDHTPGLVEHKRAKMIKDTTDALVEVAIVAKRQGNKKRLCNPCGLLAALFRMLQAFFGCCSSASIRLVNACSLIIMQSLVMNAKDIYWYRSVFLRIDIGGSGILDFEELCEFIGEVRSPFTDFLFTLTTDPATEIIQIPLAEQIAFYNKYRKASMRVRGKLNFNDFVQVTAIFCSYTRDEILEFAFNSFDTDGSGAIDELEYKNMCEVVNNMSPMFSRNFDKALESFGWQHSGEITFGHFQMMNEKFPMLMFPAFLLQDKLQAATLGKRRWNQLCEDALTRKKLDQFRQMHNGHLPEQGFWSACVRCGADPRFKKFGFEEPKDFQPGEGGAHTHTPQPAKSTARPKQVLPVDAD